MRKLRRSVARAYAREYGIKRPNKRFGVLWRKLLARPDKTFETRRDTNQRRADLTAAKRRAAHYTRLGLAPRAV